MACGVISKYAMACSRLAPGKSLRNSPSESPAERYCIKTSTGTRVPAKTNAPLTTSGARETYFALLHARLLSRESFYSG